MSKIKQNFIFLCESAFLSDGNKLNIIGIFENINVTAIPAVHLKLVLVGSFDILDDKIKDIQIAIKLIKPNKTEVKIAGPKISINNPNKNKLNILFEMGNTKFEEVGKHVFEIYANEEKISEIPLVVNKI